MFEGMPEPAPAPSVDVRRAARRYVLGLLLLTAATGCLDAVSYLDLDRVFTGNMTGNVLFVGFALVGVPGIPLLNNLVALAAFFVGAILGARLIGRGHVTRMPARLLWSLTGTLGLTLVVGVVWVAVGSLDPGAKVWVTAVLALVLGAQVAVIKPIGNSDLSTIVVTNTLANLGRDSVFGGGKGGAWVQRALAVVAMCAGAAIGAALSPVGGGWAVLAAVVIGGAALLTFAIERRAERDEV
jgi:uncharacterized membrane protein YoaK (UPF0700 family)